MAKKSQKDNNKKIKANEDDEFVPPFPLKEYIDTIMHELICEIKLVKQCDIVKWLYCKGLPTIYKALRAIVCYLFEDHNAKLYRHIFNTGFTVSDTHVVNAIGLNFEVYSYNDEKIIPTMPIVSNFISELNKAQTNNQPDVITPGVVQTINGSMLWMIDNDNVTTRAIIGIRFRSATLITLEAPGIDGPGPGSLTQIQYDINGADITGINYFIEEIIPV